MRVRRADKIARQHPVELDVIDIVTLALGEARILDTLAGTTHTLQVGNAVFAGFHIVLHSAASVAAFISAAAARMDLTMF